jgi:hypothetical protein
MTRPISVVPAGATNHSSEPEPGSVLALLRAAAASARVAKKLELPVGGPDFGDRLVVRYRVLPPEELDRFMEPAQGGTLRVSAFGVDMMVSACETVLWRQDGTETDLEVRLDSGLWELLGWPLPPGTELADLTPREIVLELFGGNGVAQMAHANRLLEWMQNPGAPPVGESSAATS